MSKLQSTPGPWHWNLNQNSKHLRLESTATGRFHEIVIDFVRWGMGGAKPRFRVNNIMIPGEKFAQNIPGHDHHAHFFQTISHPDAQLIAAAPCLQKALSDLVFLCESELEKQVMKDTMSPAWFDTLQAANTALERSCLFTPDPLPQTGQSQCLACGNTSAPYDDGSGNWPTCSNCGAV